MDTEFDAAADFLNQEKEILGDLQNEIINGRNKEKLKFLIVLIN